MQSALEVRRSAQRPAPVPERREPVSPLAMADEVMQLVAGMVAVLMPFALLSMPAIVLFVLLPMVLLAVPAIVVALLLAPPLLVVRTARRWRRRSRDRVIATQER